MKRLYPQVLKARKNIQDLRDEFTQATSVCKTKWSELEVADRQIRDLHHQLMRIEREQKDLSHDLDLNHGQSRNCQSSLDEVFSEEDTLKERHDACEADIRHALGLIEEAHRANGKLDGFIVEAEAEIEACSEQLVAAQRVWEDTDARQTAILLEGDALLAELEVIEQLRGARFDEANMAKQEKKVHVEVIAAQDAQERLRRSHVAGLERFNAEHYERLRFLEAKESENCLFRGQISANVQQKADCVQRTGQSKSASEEAVSAREEADREAEALQSELAQAEKECLAARARCDEAERDRVGARRELQAAVAEVKELRSNLSEAGDRRQVMEETLASELAEAELQNATWQATVARLQGEASALRSATEASEAKNGELGRRTGGLGEETGDLKSRNAELHQAVTDLKKKPACVIC